MFEKSLYDLIQGLRKHKGTERAYIQESLRECRKEIKNQDMNVKATALLKLTYLEMFGYDMSWAAFNVLEVMSSQNYVQKRVGYLAAIQSFRPDTDVLMLAENLLKKDLTSATPVVIALPLTAIPHVINPSMANSLLSDLLPRLTHSHAAIRKKTIVTLYRLALVYPETLRPAWPKIKDRLQDESEDPSVTSAIVNVVCELGWRRPQDFLPLAPRLFDLLVHGSNNWMAIKIIKLFATLTPLEPRLIRKLLPPLTNIIKTTPAMSLLYECVNGIIQGGILEAAQGTTEGEEIAKLCVSKLRSMLVVEGDPNLKYVALLAFQKIVSSHPALVSLHQDVILECIDDGDISIRMRALELAVGMVNDENITSIVERLLRQLQNAPLASAADDPSNDRGVHEGIMPAAEDSDEEAETSLRRSEKRSDQPPPLPEEYRIQVLRSILEMCSRDTYANINDFEWYIDVLVQLVRNCPTVTSSRTQQEEVVDTISRSDIASEIGKEIQNIAVRIKAMRPEATIAAQNLIMIDQRDRLFPAFGNGGQGVLEYAAWIVGEFADYLTNPNGVMDSLLDTSSLQLPAHILAIYVHASLKVFAATCSDEHVNWTLQRRSYLTLVMAKIIHFLEPLATNPDLEVQERAVEYLELLKLSSEAASGHPVSSDTEPQEPPLLLTQAIPSLFTGMELNPVAPGAQRKVPMPEGIDLNAPINQKLESILRQAEEEDPSRKYENEFEAFYNERIESVAAAESAADRLALAEKEQAVFSYQNSSEDDIEVQAKRQAQRKERNRDDPFYIDSNDTSAAGRLHSIIRNNNNNDLDIDSIPIMSLDLQDAASSPSRSPGSTADRMEAERKRKAALRMNFEIQRDESLGEDASVAGTSPGRSRAARARRNLLEVDSSGLGALSLEEGGHSTKLEIEQRAEEERAMREVERLRLEMQRASERIQAKEESTVVRKKKKKVKPKEPETLTDVAQTEGSAVAPVVKNKQKKKKPSSADDGVASLSGVAESLAKPKKKKARQVDLTGPSPEADA